MSVKIEIINPEQTSPRELQAVIRMLQDFAVGALVAEPRLPIATADLPDSGAPLLTPEQAFAPNGEIAAAAAFGGNAAAATLGASFQMPALPGAAALSVPTGTPTAGEPVGQAAAFGFNPNFNPATGVAPNLPAQTSEQRDVAAGSQSLPGPLLDSKGDRWDERIHAGSKTTNKTGEWTLKPKVDKDMVAQVLAANKGAGSYPFQNTAAPAAQAPAPAASLGIPQMSAPAAPSPAPTPVPAAATSASPFNVGAVNYPALVGAVQQRLIAGHLTVPEMVGICNQHGAADIPALVTASPEVLASVVQHLGALLASKGVA